MLRLSNLTNRKVLFSAILLLGTSALATFSLLAPLSSRPSQPELHIGDVANQEILAPHSISYESEILTEQLRDSKANLVLPQYLPPDAGIARDQIDSLTKTMDFINVVRADGFSSLDQKLEDLNRIEGISLKQETYKYILALDETKWQKIQGETKFVLEQVMRGTIREDRLEDAIRSIPSLVSLSLSEDEVLIVSEIVTEFTTPNSLYSDPLTNQKREDARNSVLPITKSFVMNEIVIPRGHVINDEDLEALHKLGLLETNQKWQNRISPIIFVFLSMIYILLYMKNKPELANDVRGLSIIAALFLVFLFSARIIIPDRAVIPFVFPLAAFGLTVASLFGTDAGIMFALPLGVLASYSLAGSLELTLYYSGASIFGVFILGRAERFTNFFYAGIGLASIGFGIVAAFRLPEPGTDLLGIATLAGAALVNGVASAGLAILLQYFLAQFLGLTTTLQLLEISRPDHPLVQLLLRNAPGTYQHGLQVANLAEQAAEQIGADALLTRVGALYHDIGKSMNPMFFIENLAVVMDNPHEHLDPVTSASFIIRHVHDGLKLAKKHRLPKRIRDFISEHHGTGLTRYQYAKAIEAAGGDESTVDENSFRYPGPKPRSKETAILMMADACEARLRAEKPESENDLRALVKSVIDNRVASGQLDHTDLSLNDLRLIVDSFSTTLRGIYHPRIEYPKLDAPAKKRTEASVQSP